MQKIAIATRAELKHDIDFIKKQNELKQGPMDRKDRRQYKLNLKHEKKYEEGMLQKHEEEMKVAQNLNAEGQLNRVSAQPQIYHALNYMANYFVRFLPTAKCGICGNQLATDLKEDEDNSENLPVRAYCGHWLRYKCFEKYVNTKPFKRKCPYKGCEKILASPEFPCDNASVKGREKKWLQQQEREGEKDQLDNLFGGDDYDDEY